MSTSIRGEFAVTLADVSFTYPAAARPAIDGVSLTVRSGEAVVIAGESGSGKSTLARLVVGLLRATGGTVRTGGMDPALARPQAIAGFAGLVFQNPNHQLFASTVRDELALGPRNLGMHATGTATRVDEAAGRLGLETVLGDHPYRLGIAVRRRVALAAVLAMRPRLLVLDEPSSGQGPADAARISALIRDEAASGTTLIVITHDLTFAAGIAERIVVLREGRVHGDGPVRDVLAGERLLDDAGLVAPQIVRLASRLGLSGPHGALLTPDELLPMLAARDGGVTGEMPGAAE